MYSGPDPKTINANWPSHSYEYITCLVSGESKKSILNKHLEKYGYNRDLYQKEFPDAPLMSKKSRESYRKSALTEKGRASRSKNLTRLNLYSKDFQEKRKQSCKEFLNSDRSEKYRKNAAEKTRKQHRDTDLSERIRKYFKTRYKGSLNQKQRSDRMKGKNNIVHRPDVKNKAKDTYIKNSIRGVHSKETRFKKKRFENTDLIYQSTYELDFLNLCKEQGVIDRLANCHCFTSDEYPYNFYEPDYCLDNQVIIEIKSWYVEMLQEKKYPGILQLKQKLVESKGYTFFYIREKEYHDFLELVKNHS